MTSGGNLPISNPFTDFNFIEIDSVFLSLDISGLNLILSDHIKPTSRGDFSYQCFLKMNTVVQIKGQPPIDLNTQFQTFSQLFGFTVTTRSGGVVETFTSEPRLRCDVIEALDGTRLDYRVTTQSLKLNVFTYDEGGSRKLVSSVSNGLSAPVIFNDRPDGFDPISNMKGLFIGNERAIGRAIVTQASSVENVLNPSSTISTRVELRLDGNLLIEIPFLSQQAGQIFRVNVPINDALVHNSLSIIIPIAPEKEPVLGEDLTIAITNISPSVFDTSGRDRIKLLKVTVRTNDFGSNETNPICTVFKGGRDRSGAIISTTSIAQATSTFQSSGGVDTIFLCTLKIGEDIPLGTYSVRAETNASNRPATWSTFEVTRTNPSCGTGEKFDIGLQICVDDPTTPTPPDNGDPTTKPCYSCPPESKVFRTIPIGDTCPILMCPDGTTTVDTPICKADGKPATKTATSFTCDRDGGNGNGLGIFPTFIDCEREGRDADPELGEICVPSIIFFLFTGLNFLYVGITFIIIIIVLALIAKGINRQRSGVFLQG